MLDAGVFMSFARSLLLAIAAASLTPFGIFAQSVVSARSGVVHYFEGAVLVDDKALDKTPGRFYEIKPGSELRTEIGRAEILLTPGVLLRLDENSSIRMVSNRLSDTRLEFVEGTAGLDSRNAAPGAPIVISYKDYQMRFTRAGRYRMESTPAQLHVEAGEAEVLCHDKSVAVKADQVLPFSAKLVARADDQPSGDLDRWQDQRTDALSSENKAAVDSDNLSDALNNPPADAYDPGVGYGGALTPGPYSSGTYGGSVSPLWMYAGSPFLPGYFPLYVPLAVYRGALFRPLPIRTGTLIPARSYTGLRSSSPTRLAPVHPAVHPVIHSGMHR